MKYIISTLFCSLISIQAFALDVNLSDAEEMIGTYVNNEDSSFYYEVSWSNDQLSLATNENLLPGCSDVYLAPVEKINTKFKYPLSGTEYIKIHVPIISSCSSRSFRPWLTILFNKGTKELLVKRSVIKGYKKSYSRVGF